MTWVKPIGSNVMSRTWQECVVPLCFLAGSIAGLGRQMQTKLRARNFELGPRRICWIQPNGDLGSDASQGGLNEKLVVSLSISSMGGGSSTTTTTTTMGLQVLDLGISRRRTKKRR
jgi:hypothetical protein